MPHGFVQKTAIIVLLLAGLSRSALLAQVVQENHTDIDTYIHDSWKSLERSTNDCGSVVDPKVTSKPVIYIPADMVIPEMLERMRSRCGIEIQHLPKAIRRLGDLRPDASMRPGLLYLPNPYVVPGGRFNEMYGWDSYFIILGLLNDGRITTAQGIVENFFFEIANYGAVLNANRTYFLTRSQPPLLSSMIAEVFGATHDLRWLGSAYRYAESDYALWTSADHQAGTTGLARYFDLGTGPVTEMADDSTYYPDVIRWMVVHHPQQRSDYLIAASQHPDKDETLRLRNSSCDVLSSRVCSEAYADGFRLSAAFFKGDRAMRESGFDTSFRFGPFSGSTDHFAPVCLNSLLYKYERDMATFASLLGKPSESRLWLRRAEARRRAINRYLWNPDAGTFSDYNFVDHRASTYRFATEFYPLWAGLATPEQAKRITNQLPIFERDGGLAMSNSDSGTQWDSPFGWAPAQWFAIEGLRRYGFLDDSTRLAQKFRHTVDTNYLHDGTIREKYNVVDGSANIALSAGYKTNVIGFGWTNGVYAKLAKYVLAPQASDSRTKNDTLQKQPKASSERKEKLQFALILSRHGIRPPLEQPSEYSAKPWPIWEVPLGHLTPHGGDALRQMGAYMRLKYARAGLIAGNTCPAPADVYLYSDTDERNVSSTRATFSGFAPGCASIPIRTVGPTISDPLFRSEPAATPPSDETTAARRNALLSEVPNVFSSELRAQLELLDQVLAPDPAQPAKKSIFGSSPQQAGDSSDIIEASKPRAIASEIVEDLLLEYVDNKPVSEVGWGHVDEATLLKLMPIRIAAFNLEKRTPAFSSAAGSNLLSHILDTLDQAAYDAPKHGALGPTKTRLVYISGHDSDLAGIGGLLGLHWTADGRADDTPPDSQIVFELWRNSNTKEDTVRIRYRAQTLTQLRAASSLIGASTPDEVQLVPTGCGATIGCPWNLFYKAAQERLSPDHVKRELTPSQIAR